MSEQDDTKRPVVTAPKESDPARLKFIATRMNVAQWVSNERALYADVKYGHDTEARHKLILDMRNYGLDENGEWWLFLTNYLKRAQLLGLNTPAGRQAMGKYLVTVMHCLETAVEAFGDLPEPGVPSGTIEPWRRG